MSRLDQALQRFRRQGNGGDRPGDESEGLEVFSGGPKRVAAPWRLGAEAPSARPAPAASEDPARARPPDPPASPSSRQDTAVERTTAPPRRRAFPVRGAVALLAVAAGAYGLSRAGGARGPTGPLRLTGVVVANRVTVSAKAAGRIERLTVQEGDRVEKGQVIARLDREETDAERDHQLALVRQLSARLRQAREVVLLEDGRGRGRTASAEAGLAAARSQLEEAAATLDQLRKDLDRVQSLLAEGLVSRQEVERAGTEVRAAEARQQSLADQVTRAEAEVALARANERQAAVAERDVDQSREQLAQARAQLAQVEARLGETEVAAPLSGVVSIRVAREGEVTRLGDPIVTIVDLDDVWVRAEVEESLMSRVSLGQELPVELASGERLAGRVTHVEPEAQFATQRDVSRVKRDIRTFGIKVALANPDRRIHHGMTAYVVVPDAPPAGRPSHPVP